MKGKGKGQGDRRPLDCHNCGGDGHPKRLCPSPEGAKDLPGDKCNICKGKGHFGRDCTSVGGGKFVSFGKNGKGKGKGKDGGKGAWKGGKGKGGPSQYFHGKGSGGMASVDQSGEWYSAAQWEAWSQQQNHQSAAGAHQHSHQPQQQQAIDQAQGSQGPGGASQPGGAVGPWMTQQQGRANTVAGGVSTGGGGLGSLGPGQQQPLVRYISMLHKSSKPLTVFRSPYVGEVGVANSVSALDHTETVSAEAREKFKNSFVAAFNRRCPSQIIKPIASTT